MKIILLASGQLGFKCLTQIQAKYSLEVVFTDKKSSAIIEYCNGMQIPVFIGNPRTAKGKSFVKGLHCELLLSINYLFIIEENLLKTPSLYAINLHGSLLPKYRGRTPHVWAIINGEKETGITAHLMEKGVDTGAIVYQKKIPISSTNTGAEILKKFGSSYPEVINIILDQVGQKKVELKEQDDRKATFFGKRTPKDGQIDWNWSKERIYNWIRAQAKPYPGAFTFDQKNKIIIHQARFSDYGYDWQMPNGLVLNKKAQTLIVKTPNGCLKLSQLEGNLSDIIENKTTFK